MKNNVFTVKGSIQSVGETREVGQKNTKVREFVVESTTFLLATKSMFSSPSEEETGRGKSTTLSELLRSRRRQLQS
jgi:hypothetical protein